MELKHLALPNFINCTNWEELRKQKQTLIKVAETVTSAEDFGDLYGLIHYLDSIQDWAADEAGFGEEEVFGFKS